MQHPSHRELSTRRVMWLLSQWPLHVLLQVTSAMARRLVTTLTQALQHASSSVMPLDVDMLRDALQVLHGSLWVQNLPCGTCAHKGRAFHTYS